MAKEKASKINKYVALDDVYIDGEYIREGQTKDFIEGQEPKAKKGKKDHWMLLKENVGETEGENLSEEDVKLKALVEKSGLNEAVLGAVYLDAGAKSTSEKIKALKAFIEKNEKEKKAGNNGGEA